LVIYFTYMLLSTYSIWEWYQYVNMYIL